jgi:hypothetical protein
MAGYHCASRSHRQISNNIITALHPIPSPAIGYYILAYFILRTLLVSYSELLENLGKAFKLTYAKILKCIAWTAMG